MRQALVDLLQENCHIVGSVGDGNSVFAEVDLASPHVILLGVAFEGTTGFEIARRLRRSECCAKIIIVSLNESQDMVRAALAIGVSGYVFMSRLLDDLPAAINAVCEGQVFAPSA